MVVVRPPASVAESPPRSDTVPAASDVVVLDAVGVRRGRWTLLGGVDLAVAPGEIVAVTGPSGCGASTLLAVAAGRLRPSTGRVRTAERRAVRVVAGDDSLPLRRRARTLLRRPGTLVRRPRPDAATLATVGLGPDEHGSDPRGSRHPRALGGGDRQRLALARALTAAPRLLILDDPLSRLHSVERAELAHGLARTFRDRGTAVVWATRDTAEAFAVADRVLVLSNGRAVATGTPEQVAARGADPELAPTLGPLSAVPGIVDGDVVDVWGREVPLATSAHDGHCEVLIRPEDVLFVDDDVPGVEAVVEESMLLGGMRRTVVRAADGSLVRVQHSSARGLAPRERVRIALADVAVSTRPLG